MTRGVPAEYWRISEAEFQTKVMDLARLSGWRVVHIPTVPSRGQHFTPYVGHAGLSDLVLARDGRVMLAELKSATGRASLDQLAWLDAAGENGRLWRPEDWDDIEATLLRRYAA